jgi:hypothetical protein
LFVRFGDTLMPLGCKRDGTWKSGAVCIGKDRSLVRLHPGFQSEPRPAPAIPALLASPVSNTFERGLLLAGSKDPLIDFERPLLGFATRNVLAPLRFSPEARKRLERDAAKWCSKGSCPGPLNQELTELVLRDANAEEKERAPSDVRKSLESALGGKVPVAVMSVFSARVGGAPQEIFILQAIVNVAANPKGIELPPSLHFLLKRTSTGFLRLNVVRDDDFQLGEAGEPLAVADLDGDGTDELVLEWRYAEGRYYQLVRFDGDRLVMIGQFGVGT